MEKQIFNQENATVRSNPNWMNYDTDRDGLTNREERVIGTDPYAEDSDGDRKLDGQEVIHGGQPGQPKTQLECIREEYYQIAQGMVGDSCKNWQDVYNGVKGDKPIGRNLDWMVFTLRLQQGKSIEHSAELLSQSPFLQWHYQHGNMNPQQMVDYTNDLIDEYCFAQQRQQRQQLDLEQ